VDSKAQTIQIVKRFFTANSEKLVRNNVRAVYLWGSIAREDFRPAISDVDCVAISDGISCEGLIRSLRDQARFEHKELLAKLNTRILLTSDLNGFTRDTELARILDPRLLLTNLSSWIWVWGVCFSLSSFNRRPCSMKESYQIELDALKARMERCLSVPRTEAPRHVLKAAGYLIHVIHQLNDGEHPFTYSELEMRSNSVTAPIARTVFSMRSRDWPDSECEREIPVILGFLKQIESASFDPENIRSTRRSCGLWNIANEKRNIL
jgi:hypothetical protein